MISVLIPVYNNDVNTLVKRVHTQLTAGGVPFEILFLEDGSKVENITANHPLNQLENTVQLVSEKNRGRLNTRNELSDQARFEWLLFIDSDTLPKTQAFIQNYLEAIDDEVEAIFGGFAYSDEAPDKELLLRWRYGRTFEEKPARKRNRKPYKLIISANFMIQKRVLNSLNLSSETKRYGHDSFFSSRLKQKQVRLKHIDNEVYHLGLESNSKYLKKKEQAARTMFQFYESGQMPIHENSLLQTFTRIKRFGLRPVFSLAFKLLRKPLRLNLTGKNPNVYALQLYRIMYLCKIAG